MLVNSVDFSVIKGAVTPFWSDGTFSLHDYFEIIAQNIGPCDVMLSSFSISEVSLRCLYRYKETGIINDLTCVFDHNVFRHKKNLLFFAKNLTDKIRANSCHAKVVIFENEKHSIAIVGSANFTENKRHECGFIVCDKKIVDAFKQQLLTVYESGYEIDF